MTGDNRATWTDDMVALLRILHAEGHSFGVIGAQLGVSRNAAIGKATRLGFEKRGSPNPKPIVRPTRKTGLIRARLATAETAAADMCDLEPEQVANPLTLMQLEPDSCRWPVSGEGADTLFCGAKAADGCSYCARHYRMSTVNNGRNLSRAAAEIGRREAARNYRKRKAA